ncbi:hypothetical protein Salat_1243200 [Sesamum alatum]|uniref:Uncharacterized protein n=1 Tax=Sesamum alatum TaxID=300844 RepID=A0AAE1YG52_9LAMI|nr:hypothetical protein Salat_1243200 [Sesamum alatum]
MWPDGFYYQSQIFYNSRWTCEMEHTFVDSLVEHSRSGLFHPDQPSIHVVMCSLYDVNKKYGTKVVYEHKHVLNASESDTTLGGAPNHEDELAPHGPNNEPVPVCLHAAQAPDAPQAEPAPDMYNNEPAHDAMHAVQAPHAPLHAQAHDGPQAEPVPDDVGSPKQVMYLSDSSSESSSIWRALHEYYGSDNDADFVLPSPGVPLWKGAKYSHHSPASRKSGGCSSSIASNPTPIKKKEWMQEVISTCGGLGR